MFPKQKRYHLGRSQRAAIEEIANGLTVYQALQKYRIPLSRYNKWLENKSFIDWLEICISGAIRQRLNRLTLCESPETSRKACLDMIAMQKNDIEQLKTQTDGKEDNSCEITSRENSVLLSVLAEIKAKKAGQVAPNDITELQQITANDAQTTANASKLQQMITK